MSTMEEKTATPQESTGPARRVYRTLLEANGFRHENARDGRAVLSICPMDTRSYWQHDGREKWNAAEAQYAKVEESP